MSIEDLFNRNLMIKHPDPGTSADTTGQLFVDETGQPIGDATTAGEDWSDAFPVRGSVQEITSRWPEGPGAGPQLVDTHIYLPTGSPVRELDKILDEDEQAYQVVWAADPTKREKYVRAQARRIPL